MEKTAHIHIKYIAIMLFVSVLILIMGVIFERTTPMLVGVLLVVNGFIMLYSSTKYPTIYINKSDIQIRLMTGKRLVYQYNLINDLTLQKTTIRFTYKQQPVSIYNMYTIDTKTLYELIIKNKGESL